MNPEPSSRRPPPVAPAVTRSVQGAGMPGGLVRPFVHRGTRGFAAPTPDDGAVAVQPQPPEGSPAAADATDRWPHLVEAGTASRPWGDDDDHDRPVEASADQVPDSPLARRIRAALRDVPDFPRPGILFKDITPVLADPSLFRDVVDGMALSYRDAGIDMVAGVESRGFILGGALAAALGAGFMPVRKPGKLPHQRLRVEYELEYGSDSLEAHIDALRPGARVLVVDDVLATGGTAWAAVELVRQLGGDVAAAVFLVELGFLHGRRRLPDVSLHSLLMV